MPHSSGSAAHPARRPAGGGRPTGVAADEVSLATRGIEKHVEELAVEFREKLEANIRDDPEVPLALVERAGPDVLILETAITEVVANEAWLAAIGLAAWGSPIIPAGVAAGTVAAFRDRGWVSIEARVREGSTLMDTLLSEVNTMIYRLVQECARSVGNLQVCLDKAIQHAAAKKFDVNILLTSRLAPDQHHFIYQVQSACDYVKGAAAWLSGQALPKHEDNEKTIDEVRERIQKTLAFVKSVKEDQFLAQASAG